ncbi:hypothetical protein B0H65DRAFT_236421 [Neurospora tetraspora]|uniref:Secreted protein n=1 Tax=Neurospora tetraspora TaxID=94610 RepID=A0AAE0MQQ4_9PEZI|nr:hypothetical protein B0H65DRAFT_236421 [Neurospora tetraspora]
MFALLCLLFVSPRDGEVHRPTLRPVLGQVACRLIRRYDTCWCICPEGGRDIGFLIYSSGVSLSLMGARLWICLVLQDATVALPQSRHVHRHHARGYNARADLDGQACPVGDRYYNHLD